MADEFDPAAMTAAWEVAVAAPSWDHPGVWIHGDLAAANLLSRDGALTGVIDFGLMAVGDPAAELIVAWNFLSGEAREVFRATLGDDEAAWARGRGWALSTAAIVLPYYRDSNPALVAAARRTIGEVLGGCSG